MTTEELKPIEIEPDVTEVQYEEYLSEIYGDVDICGMPFDSGRALKELDPTAFRCGLVDYESGLESKWKCPICELEYDTEEDAAECLECCREDND